MATPEQTTERGGQPAQRALPLPHEAGTGRVTSFYLADVLARLAAEARARHERSTGPDPPGAATRPRSRGARTSRAAAVTRADHGSQPARSNTTCPADGIAGSLRQGHR